MITRTVLLFQTARRYLIAQLRKRAPLLTAALLHVPVKTLAVLNGCGVISVVFASVQHVRLDTFGAACGAVACLLLTLSMRVATDDEVPSTFGGIMTGTLRQKTRALHDGLLYGAAGVAAVGFAVMGAERVAEHVRGEAAWPRVVPSRGGAHQASLQSSSWSPLSSRTPRTRRSSTRRAATPSARSPRRATRSSTSRGATASNGRTYE